jgi:hypothetical protein
MRNKDQRVKYYRRSVALFTISPYPPTVKTYNASIYGKAGTVIGDQSIGNTKLMSCLLKGGTVIESRTVLDEKSIARNVDSINE